MMTPDRIREIIKQDAIGAATRLFGPPDKMESGRYYWLSPLRADRNPGFEITAKGECFDGNQHKGDIIDVFAAANGMDASRDFKNVCERIAPVLGIMTAAPTPPEPTPEPFPLTKIPAVARMEQWAAAYGLTWAAFKKAGVELTKNKWKDHNTVWALKYPTLGEQGEGGKVRSLERLDVREDGKTKRLVKHLPGGAGFFPPCDLRGPGRLRLTAGEEKSIALRAFGRAVSYSCGEGAVTKKLCKWLVEQGNTEFDIVYDADLAGRQGADATAERLVEAGATSVRIVSLPDGMDVNDVVVKEGPDALRGYVEAAQLWKPGVATEAASEYARQSFRLVPSTDTCGTQWPARQWVIDGLIPRGVTVLFGLPKVGKTLFVNKMVGCIAMGREFLGFPTERKEILYIDGESDRQGFAERMKLLGFDHGLSGLYEFCPEDEWQFDKKGMAEVEAALAEHPQLKVIVLDTLENLVPYPEKMDSGLNAQQRDVQRLKPIRKWCARLGVSVIIIHHPKKGRAEGDFFSTMAGSNGLRGTAETIIGIEPDGDSEEIFRLRSSSRYMPGLDISLERLKGSVQWNLHSGAVADAEPDASPLQAAIMAYLDTHPYSRPSAIARGIGSKRGTVGTICTRLRKKGVLGCTDKGLYFILRGEADSEQTAAL